MDTPARVIANHDLINTDIIIAILGEEEFVTMAGQISFVIKPYVNKAARMETALLQMCANVNLDGKVVTAANASRMNHACTPLVIVHINVYARKAGEEDIAI